MATFFYRVRGKGPIELAATRAPAGPWLELEAESFEAARRELAEISAETGFIYEARESLDDEAD